MRLILTLIITFLISSCDSGILWEDGRYKVRWIDVYENRTLGYYLDDGFKVPRIGHEIVAIGSDDIYIVVKQFKRDTGKIKFYYIIKSLDAVETDLSPGVKGPFSLEEFNAIKIEMKFPEFSKEF